MQSRDRKFWLPSALMLRTQLIFDNCSRDGLTCHFYCCTRLVPSVFQVAVSSANVYDACASGCCEAKLHGFGIVRVIVSTSQNLIAGWGRVHQTICHQVTISNSAVRPEPSIMTLLTSPPGASIPIPFGAGIANGKTGGGIIENLK